MGTRERQQPLIQFGERVRAAREAKALTQEQLAEIAGIHRTYVGTVERGERNPALLNILRLAAALQVDPALLVSGIRP